MSGTTLALENASLREQLTIPTGTGLRGDPRDTRPVPRAEGAAAQNGTARAIKRPNGQSGILPGGARRTHVRSDGE